MNQQDAAMADLDLIALKNLLDEVGLNSVLVDKSSLLPISTLIVSLEPENQEGDRTLNFSFIPLPDDAFPDIKLLQCYSELPITVENAHTATVAQVLLAINLTLPLGGFGLRIDPETTHPVIYFRYTHSLPKYEMIANQSAALIDMVRLVAYGLDVDLLTLEQVLTGEITAEAAITQLASDDG